MIASADLSDPASHDDLPGLQFSVLGPLEVRAGGAQLKIGPLKQRIALAILLCHANRVVPVTDLSDAIWGSETPRTAHKNLQVYISLLRGILFPDDDGAARLSYRFPGYRLEIAPPELDLLTFENLVRGGRAAIQRGDTKAGAGALHAALKTWRGTALTDLASLPVLDAEANRLNNLRAAVYEDWAEAELTRGNHSLILEEIEDQVQRHPLRERLRRVQLLALSRSGRHTEALAEYDELRVSLARDLGLQPSGALRQVYQAILEGDPDVRPVAKIVPAPRDAREVLAHTALLPRDSDRFTGRDAELATLAAAMRGAPAGAARVGVLAGQPGAGKTALAVRAAHQLRDVFPDGQLLLSMRTPGGRARTALDILGQFLRMAGLEGAMPRQLEERAPLYRAFMAGRSMLIILDDAADASAVRWLLPGTGSNGVLITSRRRLATFDASFHLDLGPLSTPAAVTFLGDMIGAHRVEAEPEAASTIVERCGRLPLAVRTAGTKLRLQPYLPLATLAERLGDDSELFDVLEIGDLSVRANAAAHVRELAPGQLPSLRRIAALPADGFGLDVMAAGLGLPRQQVEQLIDALLEVNALESTGRGQFAVPRLLRSYLSPQPGSALGVLVRRGALAKTCCGQEWQGAAGVGEGRSGRGER